MRNAVLGGAAVALAGLAAGQGAPGITAIGPVRRRFFPGLAGQGRAGHVALTFDDGPDPASTPSFLATLDAHRIRATFFLLGPMVRADRPLAAEVAAAGHEIGVHGWAHRYATLRSPWALYDDLARAYDTIAEVTGAAPRWYRPAYGVLSAGSLLACHRLGLRPVLWTCWGREWDRGATPDSVQATLSRTLAGGATVLLHDSSATARPGAAAAALGALPWLLGECTVCGLAVGPLAEHGLAEHGLAGHGLAGHGLAGQPDDAGTGAAPVAGPGPAAALGTGSANAADSDGPARDNELNAINTAPSVTGHPPLGSGEPPSGPAHG
jgi:peptidoglycan-N-acetylglucosamine deacetylase